MQVKNHNDNIIYKLFIEISDPSKTIVSFGPSIMKLNYIVNTQKAGTIIFLYVLMIYFNNYSLGAWVYLSLHGTYGIIWIIKDMVVPDKSFQEKVTVPVLLLVSSVLLLYWSMGVAMVIGIGDQNPSGQRIFIAFVLFIIGVLLMLLTDMQKHIILSYKKGLIDNYYFSCNRNTNYLGEMLIYSSFAIIIYHWFPLVLLLLIWSTLFLSRMLLKEESLKKKQGYEEYKSKSYLFLFKIFNSDLLNMLFYTVLLAAILLLVYYS